MALHHDGFDAGVCGCWIFGWVAGLAALCPRRASRMARHHEALLRSRYRICRFDELQEGDLVLEPFSGVASRVTGVKDEGGRRVRIRMLVGRISAVLELPPDRPMRRGHRPGEKVIEDS